MRPLQIAVDCLRASRGPQVQRRRRRQPKFSPEIRQGRRKLGDRRSGRPQPNVRLFLRVVIERRDEHVFVAPRFARLDVDSAQNVCLLAE